MKTLLTALLLLALPTTLLSATIHVPGDYATIQEGIDAAVTGDTVLVGPGFYTEHLAIAAKAIVLTTEFGPDSTTLWPPNVDIPAIDIDLGDIVGMEVSGFFVLGGFSYQEAPVIRVESFVNVLITGNRFDFWAPTGILSEGKSLIVRNRFTGANWYAVTLLEPLYSQVIENTFVDCYCAVLSNAPMNITQNIIMNSTIPIIDYSWYTVIEHNLFWDSGEGFVVPPNNILADPLLCGYGVGDLHLHVASSCVATNNEWGVQIGALGVGCACDCGDCDCSGFIGISDVVYLVEYIFLGGEPPFDIRAGDANCSGATDVADAICLIAYIFTNCPAPCAECP